MTSKTIVWPKCGCPREHRDHREFVRCKYSRMNPKNINGSGNWVAVTWCTPARITLWLTKQQAINRVEQHNAISCGALCKGPEKHHLAEIRMLHPKNKDRTKPE